MKRIVAFLILALIAAGIWWLVTWRNQPPEIEFAKVTRENIVDLLSTNGKLEPVEWASARNETPGVVQSVLVKKGQRVAKGAPILEMEVREAKAALDSANARIAQIRVELDTIAKGGRAAELAAIDGSLASAKVELANAQKEVSELERLAARNAATAFELTTAKQRVTAAQVQIQSLDSRRASLAGAADRAAAEARLRDAESARKLAERQIELGTVRAPMSGTVYQLDVRAGDYIQPGTLVASVGDIAHLRALIYVDEPELGRVGVGKPVSITWDALRDKEWKGTVQKLPAQITALGTRQVGEVQCIVENPGLDLLPGSNVNAFIRAEVVDNAIAVPKAALRRENNENGVFLLEGDHVVWRPVKLGVSSLVRAEVKSGLKDGDMVAMPTERPLTTGYKVLPKSVN